MMFPKIPEKSPWIIEKIDSKRLGILRNLAVNPKIKKYHSIQIKKV